jgi:hypothetical protein
MSWGNLVMGVSDLEDSFCSHRGETRGSLIFFVNRGAHRLLITPPFPIAPEPQSPRRLDTEVRGIERHGRTAARRILPAVDLLPLYRRWKAPLQRSLWMQSSPHIPMGSWWSFVGVRIRRLRSYSGIFFKLVLSFPASPPLLDVCDLL